MLINFDESQDWFPKFDSVFGEMARDVDWKYISDIEFIEDAFKVLCNHVGAGPLSEAFYESFKCASVLAFHGTRLTDPEVQCVSEQGLKPLSVVERLPRYERVFGSHPEWPNKSAGLRDALDELGPKATLGNREDGRVWCCYSRAGLLDCDFTVHGAEIDHHVADRLFGINRAHGYLRNYGLPRIVSFWCTMQEAEDAISPFYDKPPNELSAFAKRLIGHWAYSKAVPDHCCALERDATQMGCGFKVGADRIVSIETLET